MKNEKSTIYYQNPKIDFLGMMTIDGDVPVKKDSYKPVTLQNTENKEDLLQAYLKNPTKKNVKAFQEGISSWAKQKFNVSNIIKKPTEVELIISISMKKSRFEKVDLDNLSKTALDGLKGVAFEDDAQVSTLICQKHISEPSKIEDNKGKKHHKQINSLLIGITRITQNRKGVLGDLTLYSKSKDFFNEP